MWFSNNVLLGIVQISTRPNVHVLSDTKVFKRNNLPRWQVVVMMIWEEPGLR